VSDEKPATGPMIRCLSPWDGSEIGAVPAEGRQAAAAAVSRARAAQPGWWSLGHEGRAAALLAVRDDFVSQAEELVALVGKENGKPPVEAWFAEILPNIELFSYWAKHVPRFMRDEKLKLARTKYPGKKGHIRLVPKGVVAVISAWNYPVALSLRPIVPALLAGNTVVYKASSESALVGEWLARCFARHLPEGVLVPFTGPGALGSAIVEAGVDHLCFIGSVEVGREIGSLAARSFTSCSLELGGKDAAIVLPDADVERAVEGICWGAFTNAGQNCASIERLLVHDSIAATFLPRLVARTRGLRVCVDGPAGSDVGPVRNPGQLDTMRAQVADAKQKGARILCGGEAVGPGCGFQPTIVDDVTAEMAVWNDESFGPLLPVRRFASDDEAVALANACRYGLTNSVWTSDAARGQRLAERLQCGVVTINNHAYTGSMPFAPWGGIKHTGMGSTNSHHALMELVRPQVIVTDPPRGHEFFWYPYDAVNLELAEVLKGFLTGRGGLLKVLGLMKRATRARAPGAARR
jgi:acyl-CoA reductase-like NAD-dependent aldehyde dehydrogenase